MNTNKAIFVVIAVLVLVAISVGAFFLLNKKDAANSPGPSNPVANEPSSNTRETNIGVVDVPELGEEVPEDVAPPTVVGPGSVNLDNSYRSFDISVENNRFVPSTVIVKATDITNLYLTAVDRDYDFHQPDYGLTMPLVKGKKTMVQFQATATGKFTFYCQSCGGPDKGPVGYIVVSE